MKLPRVQKTLSTLTLLPAALAIACSGSRGGSSNPPTLLSVVATSPPNGAVEVNIGSLISVTFDDELDPSILGQPWIGVLSQGVPIPGDLQIDPSDSRTLVLTPFSTLPEMSTVIVSVAPGVRSISGRVLAPQHVWSFGTEDSGLGSLAFQVDTLPDLRQGASGSLDLVALHSLPDQPARVSVTWSSTSGFVENAFLEGSDTWSDTLTVQNGFFSDALSSPDGGGGVVLTNSFQFLSFGTGVTMGDLPFFGGKAMLHDDGPRLVLSAAAPGAPICGEFDPGTGAWATFTNVTGENLDFGSTVELLPYPGGFQALSHREIAAGEDELHARFFTKEGVETGDLGFGGDLDASIYASDSRVDGAALVIVTKPTPSGVEFFAIDFDPASGWGQPELIAATTYSVFEILFRWASLGDQGGAALCVRDESQDSLVVFWREAGSTSWSQTSFPTQYLLDLEVSSSGGFLLAGIGAQFELFVMGKRPGASNPWTEITNAGAIGVVGGSDFVEQVFVEPASGGRFLLVAKALAASLGDDVIRGALLSVE